MSSSSKGHPCSPPSPLSALCTLQFYILRNTTVLPGICILRSLPWPCSSSVLYLYVLLPYFNKFHAAGGRRGANVEVLFPGSNVVGSGSATASDSVPPMTSNVDSTGPASALSAAADSKSLAEKAIAALPPELSAQATDPKRKA
ncbi:hypothetical protein ACJX0J_042206, partial [Zea mays]